MGRKRITVKDTSSDGKFYAVRDENGTLVETGWISPEGVEHQDVELTSSRPRIDAGNPAAMVPWNQAWA